MAESLMMPLMPERLEERAFSGMRWTLWLTLLSVPFSLAVRVILARAGRSVLGAYGLLGVYTSLVNVFLYLGGDAVVMRFLPALAPGQRRGFLLRYCGIIAAGWLPWLGLAWGFSGQLHWLFGPGLALRLEWILVLLAPICIFYSLVMAVLKASMEIRAAQIIKRWVPLGSSLIFAALAWGARTSLREHAVLYLWTVYLAMAAGALGVGAYWAEKALPAADLFPRCTGRVVGKAMRDRRRGTYGLKAHGPDGVPATSRPVSIESIWATFCHRGRVLKWRSKKSGPATRRLPPGFWPYTWTLQANGILSFLANRADILLVLSAGGLQILGEYVALKTLAQGVRTFVKLLLDSLFPSLANALGNGDVISARVIARMFQRMIFPAMLAAVTLILCCGRLIIGLLGPGYRDLPGYIPWVMGCAAVQGVSTVHGTMINACGKPEKMLPATITRVIILLGGFIPLWHWAGLLGAIMAWGLAEGVYHIWSLCLIRKIPIFEFSYYETYTAYCVVIALMVGIMARLPHISWSVGVMLWILSGAAYLKMGRYSMREARQLSRLAWPNRWLRKPSPSSFLPATGRGN